jgi:uncharacterized protein (TIGR02186 family)
MRMTSILLALLLSAALGRPATAQKLISDVSQNSVEIEYSFTGADILVYGAILRPGGQMAKAAPGIAVVLRGPGQPITVRRKERVAGIWVNRFAVRFETAPSLYRLATSAPIRSLVDERTAAIYEIGLENLQLSPASGESPAEIDAFEKGLLDLRSREGLYAQDENGVVLTENILYRARIGIPARVPVGRYLIEIHLIEDGEVVATSTREVDVSKSGFERSVYVAAQEHSFAYGLAAVVVALGSGWLAGLIVRR